MESNQLISFYLNVLFYLDGYKEFPVFTTKPVISFFGGS